ncbi:MAG: hypothetical protein HY363_01940 [Candidatus Aenigmarchaeota archaeon]|nr:hypothetical protein [Candidatus Aenigmarchaeota archaeon]
MKQTPKNTKSGLFSEQPASYKVEAPEVPAPEKKDLIKLANDLFLVLSGKEPDEATQRRLSAAVDVAQTMIKYNPREADALTAVYAFELADAYLKSPNARKVACDVAETYKKRAGFSGKEEKQ